MHSMLLCKGAPVALTGAGSWHFPKLGHGCQSPCAGGAGAISESPRDLWRRALITTSLPRP